MHPLHPASVHAPLAGILFAPLADLGAVVTHRAEFWFASAVMCAAASGFGLIAATMGALDFERAQAKAPKTALWHASLMTAAVSAATVSAFGRFGEGLAVRAPPPDWAIGVSVVALALVTIGGALGGELVYRHGVNVGTAPRD